MAREIRGVATSGTLYARLMSPTGLWWNGTSFEAYNASNYATYVIAMTEQGASGVYVADFPSVITTSGTYQYFVHSTTASPLEGDATANTGEIDWSGIGLVSSGSISGTMSGSDWRDYILRLGFKRTDKDTELYEATTDAIQEMRRNFTFDEAAGETTTTDTITSLGDFQLNLEADFGLLTGLILQDDDTASRLIPLTKSQFMNIYPESFVTNNRGYPTHFCIFGGKIQIGPVPDSIAYTYRKVYYLRAGTITSSTAGVPFTAQYRDILADNVLARLYKGLESFDKAAAHRAEYERNFMMAVRREAVNTSAHFFVGRVQDC